LQIFETSLIGIEQNSEAENTFLVLYLSKRSILQGFDISTGQCPLKGERVEVGT